MRALVEQGVHCSELGQGLRWERWRWQADGVAMPGGCMLCLQRRRQW